MPVEGVGNTSETEPASETESGKEPGGKKEGVTSATTIKDESELRKVAPEILKGMEVALFEWMSKQQKASQERIKKMNREMGGNG